MFWKKFREHRGSIVFRLTASYAVVGLILNVVGLGSAYYIVSSYAVHAVDDELTELSRDMAIAVQARGRAAMTDELRQEIAARGSSSAMFCIRDRSGGVVDSSDLTAWPVDAPLRVPAKTEPLLITEKIGPSSVAARFIHAPLDPDHSIEIGLSLADPLEMLARLAFDFTLLGSMMVAMGATLGWIVARRAMGGIGRVTTATARIANQFFDERIVETGRGSEIDQLSQSFNVMASRIQVLMREMRETNDNIAHDLRSPLAGLRGAAESALLHKNASGETAALAGRVVGECDRLIEMITTMLDISEVESGVARLERDTVNLSDLVRDGGEIFLPSAHDKRIQLEVSTPTSLFVQGDRKKLQRLLANLIDNALKYTPEDGRVSVRLSMQGQDAAVAIEDSGIGISANDLPHIFKRFFRADASRSAQGSGLGLCLAHAVARAHGGEVLVTSTPGKGSLFTVLLPLSR